jgi:hypothetical protein
MLGSHLLQAHDSRLPYVQPRIARACQEASAQSIQRRAQRCCCPPALKITRLSRAGRLQFSAMPTPELRIACGPVSSITSAPRELPPAA